MTVRTLILRTAGTNCDYETDYAFQFAGSQTDLVHINELVRGEKELSDYQILALPGGFTYGDDIAAGKIFANELKYKLGDPVRRFIEEGRLIIGICNGFQILVRAGFLPALKGTGGEQRATLTNNDSGKFEGRWVYLSKVERTCCVFTERTEDLIYLPVAHGEGKFVVKEDEVLQKLRARGQVVFRYARADGGPAEGYPENPNGSPDHIAGICDPTGRIFGLMPHPERHILPTQHPRWTREGLKKKGDGLSLFESAVAYVKCSL